MINWFPLRLRWTARDGRALHSLTSLNRPVSLVLIVLLALIHLHKPAVAQTSCSAPSFQGLGQMPGDNGGGTFVNAISGDGSTVVGYAWVGSSATVPFRWTAAGGFEDLGTLGGANSSNSRAYGVSNNGSVIVGQSSKAGGTLSAFRWVQGTGMQELPIYHALATSNAGSVAVGMNIRWTAPGQIDHLGFLGGNNYTSAKGVSGDGQVVVGFSETSPSRYAHAFRWTLATGIQDLGVTTGTESQALGVSSDGTVIIGEARDAGQFWRAFRWTSSLGMRDMGTLGGPMSSSHGASANGSVIVGKSLINSQSSSLRAFRWTQASGMRDLKQELLNAGVTAVQNWTLAVAADVSDDGTIIAGWGYPASLTPAQPWIAVLPPAGGCVNLSSLALNPTSVTGGSSSTGTVTLSAAAPAGGQVVSLSSNNPAVASVPSSVTVAGGATGATFTITTNTVSSSTIVTLTGASGGTTRTADLTVIPTPPNTGLRGPNANAADSGGDGNGFEANPSNAHADDSANAVDNNSGSGSSTSCTSTSKDKHRFFNYGFSIPSNATIGGIEVRLDARADSTSSSPKMCVQLSWDGGVTWTAAKSTGTLGTSMNTFTLGSASDRWGRTWGPADFADANFRVRVINVSSSTSRDFFLDWVAVRVTYTQ